MILLMRGVNNEIYNLSNAYYNSKGYYEDLKKENDSLGDSLSDITKKITTLEGAISNTDTEILVNLQKQIWAAEEAKSIAQEKADFELQLLKLTLSESEYTAYIRQKELSSISDVNKAIKEQIYNLEDQTKALEKAKEISEENSNLELKIAELTLSETEYLTLTRQKELETIDKSNIPLQERIWALEDQNKADEKAKVIAEEKYNLEIQLLQLTGKSSEALVLTRKKELDKLDDSNKAIQERIWSLQDEAEKSNNIKNLEIDLLKAQGKEIQATTLQREIELSQTEDYLKSIKKPVIKSLASHINFTSQSTFNERHLCH